MEMHASVEMTCPRQKTLLTTLGAVQRAPGTPQQNVVDITRSTLSVLRQEQARDAEMNKTSLDDNEF